MEIGGFIEYEHYDRPMLHERAIALNSARNCLAYLIEAKNIKKIALPYYLCNSVGEICKKYGISVRFYNISIDFHLQDYTYNEGEWLYLVNYYGQIDNDYIKLMKQKYKQLIVDNVQAYFQEPVEGVDTIYTCRKFFGVPDGAFLYSDCILHRMLERDKSAKRMRHLLGRYEEDANSFYTDYVENEEKIERLEIKRMSLLTENLLRAIDYKNVKNRRKSNFSFLDEKLEMYNKLSLKMNDGLFMYPLYIDNGQDIREKLREIKIYIPTLWPDVFNICKPNDLEYKMALNILPLPIDQRYDERDMEWMSQEILKYIN